MRKGRTGGQLVLRGVAAVVRLQLSGVRLLGNLQILEQELHLLDDPASYDLVVLVESHGQPFAEQDLVVDIAFDELPHHALIGPSTELQRIPIGKLRFALWGDDDAMGVRARANRLAGEEEQRSGSHKMQQGLS